jgi:hypothetical protein
VVGILKTAIAVQGSQWRRFHIRRTPGEIGHPSYWPI